MKKIIPILFLFLIFYACYLIYNLTENDKLFVACIGDDVANIKKLKEINNVSNVNTDFINKDYHITDLLNTIKYNQEKDINNKTESIHQILKKTDILIISIGMNDIYYKLNDNTKEIYTYMNNLINNYELILDEISRYDYQKVYILGYYNTSNKYNDIFTYTNYKLNNLANSYKYNYLDLNKIFYNNQKYYYNNDNFYLNNKGYQQIYQLIVENLKKS